MTTEQHVIAKIESVEDQERREWAQAGCDWAYFICKFLQGRRYSEILPEEIVKTKL